MAEQPLLHLFEGFGIELEYMIVADDDLSVKPIADEVLKIIGGDYAMEVELGDVAWSNELALHVIEIKTNGPAPSLIGLEQAFQKNIRHINQLLEPMDARLLPTAMHPWMNPDRELKLWPHENDVIYKTFDRIFSCKGHGWANLQSTHLNLPFANDAEFGRLHAAIRLVLPIIPGLAASSPFMDGHGTDFLDTRLEIYRHNAARVPEVSGIVIPEQIFTQKDYEDGLLQSIYRALGDLDPDCVLHHEWVNSRGCIARFDRNAIEIRLVDVQECPQADIAVAAAITAAVQSLVEEHSCSLKSQKAWDERELALFLQDGIRNADEAVIDNQRFLQSFGYPERGRVKVRDLWQHLIETTLAHRPGFETWEPALTQITSKGCLARRIRSSIGDSPTKEAQHRVYSTLANCLADGVLFQP